MTMTITIIIVITTVIIITINYYYYYHYQARLRATPGLDGVRRPSADKCACQVDGKSFESLSAEGWARGRLVEHT